MRMFLFCNNPPPKKNNPHSSSKIKSENRDKIEKKYHSQYSSKIKSETAKWYNQRQNHISENVCLNIPCITMCCLLSFWMEITLYINCIFI